MPKVVPVSTYESPYCFTCKRRFRRCNFYKHSCFAEEYQKSLNDGSRRTNNKPTEPRTKPKVRKSPKPTCENYECKLCFPKIYQKWTYAYCELCNWHGITYAYNRHISSTGHKYKLSKVIPPIPAVLDWDFGEGTEEGVGVELSSI